VARERILAEPELFLKAQRQSPPPLTTHAAELERDLDLAVSLLERARRRLAQAMPEMNGRQREQAQCQIETARRALDRRREWERSWKPDILSQAQRTTILELGAQGVSHREIARVLQVSRLSVRKVLRSNSSRVPELHRAEKAEPYRQRILELLIACKEAVPSMARGAEGARPAAASPR
jgi:DNA-binding CsgD family transcriptional regulator